MIDRYLMIFIFSVACIIIVLIVNTIMFGFLFPYFTELHDAGNDNVDEGFYDSWMSSSQFMARAVLNIIIIFPFALAILWLLKSEPSPEERYYAYR